MRRHSRSTPVLLSGAIVLGGCSANGESESETFASTADGGSDDSSSDETSDASDGPGEDSASDSASDSGEPSDESDTGDEDETGGTKWDVSPPGDGGAMNCEGGEGQVEFSYLWVANSNEGTVSKIDTQTMQEVGRYRTRPDGVGNPSRTSVNLNGDVVVANRSGGVTMIRARAEDCLDANNTSAGPDDIKDWPDGCVEWYAPSAYSSQRPVAWTQGTPNQVTCEFEDPMVWTSGTTSGVANSVEVVLLDGETGDVEQLIPIPEIPNGAYDFGLYGAAVDGDGNMWASQLDVGYLVRVSLEDFSHDSWPMPEVGYGMTVDHLGRPWTCNAKVARFDPQSETWTVGTGEPGPGGAGCMEDAEGRMWVAGYAITAIDVESMELLDQFPMPVIGDNPDTGYGRGISIDFQGYVWSPSHWSNAVYRLDPGSGEFDKVEGLDFPYTYSDMTGFALKNAGVPAG